MTSFAFTDEQEALRATVRRFCDEKSPSSEVRRLMETTDGFDPDVWKQLSTELGLTGIHIPEDEGGQGFGFTELCIVLEEMGQSLICAPYLSSVVLAAGAIANAGTPEQRKELLPAIASGEVRAALALAEPSGRFDADGISLTTDGGRLTGTKSFVVDGHTADLLVVVAREPGTSGTDGISFFTVPGEAVEREPADALDLTRKLAEVRLDAVEATPLGERGAGGPALAKTVQQACVALANESVGGAQRCLDMAVAYAKERYQFGRPIGSFQAIKHKCADMLLDLESARSAAYYAAACAADGDRTERSGSIEELPVAASLAKAFCTEAYFRCSRESIQIHGGIGFTWEHDCHLYYRRAKSCELYLGEPSWHRELIAQELGI